MWSESCTHLQGGRELLTDNRLLRAGPRRGNITSATWTRALDSSSRTEDHPGRGQLPQLEGGDGSHDIRYPEMGTHTVLQTLRSEDRQFSTAEQGQN